jgi:hypothetical protein
LESGRPPGFLALGATDMRKGFEGLKDSYAIDSNWNLSAGMSSSFVTIPVLSYFEEDRLAETINGRALTPVLPMMN